MSSHDHGPNVGGTTSHAPRFFNSASDFDGLIDSEIGAVSVLRHRKTSIELLHLDEDRRNLLVSELLFLFVERSQLSFSGEPWFGKLKSVSVQVADSSSSCMLFDLRFGSGVWVIKAKGVAMNTFSSIPHED